MKVLGALEMQNIAGGKIQAPGAYLVCLAGSLIACATAAPLGLVELVACGYTLYKNWD